MYKYLLLLSILLFFVSCASHPNPIKPYEKAFAQEDTYILYALNAEEVDDHKTAAKLFETLYKKSNKKEYLYRSLENDLVSKDNIGLINKIKAISKNEPYDPELIRLEIVALIGLDKLYDAKILGVELASKTKKPQDYLLVSDIYIKRQEYDMAVRYLNSAYVKNYNEKILDKMAIILYVNLDRRKEAIAQLETYSRIMGCSKLICTRLISFYSNDNNINGLLSTYLRFYENFKNDKVAKKIIQIYTYKQDYVRLMNFLEKYKNNDELLLQLYSSLKDYKKAYVLSNELYDKTSEIDYLGQSAIYEYESAKNKNSKKLLSRVVKKLKKVARISKKPLYLNYLGYILIDHNIDIKKGMKYIDVVLKTQPNSAFYLDSLAWGYYKLGKCFKAKGIMSKVVRLEGGDDPEVLKHITEIDKCLKN